MLRQLKITLRALLRRRAYTLTSVFGLGVGMASCLLIALFVLDELSYDRYHRSSERIYRLVNMETGAADDQGIAKVNGPWGVSARNEIPEVEEMTRFIVAGQQLFSADGKQFYENAGFYADSTVFRVFSFRMLEGDNASALTQPNSMVITQPMNEKYFGNASGVGKLLRVNDQEFKVTGILEDIPLNSHFRFSYLLSMTGYQHPDKDNWVRWNQFYTYLRLSEGSSPDAVADKMKTILSKNLDAKMFASYTPVLQPLTDIHLYSHLFREINPNSDVSYIYIFSSIALLILIISCANFINLYTAQAASRAKEIGIRKVNGAARIQLALQFLVETSIITLMALVLAHLIAPIVLPTLNELTDKHLMIDYLREPVGLMVIFAIGSVTAILAGIYPALYLSSLKPAHAIKGKWSPLTGATLRKSLVTFQFVLSSMLVIASIVVLQQLHFVQTNPLGFDQQQIINVPIHSNEFRTNHETIRRELLTLPGVVSVSVSGNLPGGSDWGIPTLAEGYTDETMPHVRVMAVDHDFISTYGMTITSGRGFSRDVASDTAGYLINEEAARQLQWDEPLKKTIGMPAIQRGMAPVIGVVRDFHFRSMHEKIGPLVFFIPPSSWYSQYSIRIAAAGSQETLKAIEGKWSHLDPQYPFVYSFLDETYSRLYRQDQRLSKVVTVFTAIGIFLACLGLYSLASLTTEQRTKEIGIRKVIGATNRQIVVMLSGQYVRLVLIGFLVALPIALWVLQQWLQTFAYRVDFSVVLIGAGCLLSVAVALLTVGYRSMMAALTNPVDSLKNE